MSDAAGQVYVAELCSETERDTPPVSEVDDVVQGSEPGASRFSMLIPTDLYDDMAKIADSSYTDTTDVNADRPSRGTIEQLKDNTACAMRNSDTVRTVADGHDSSLENERLKPPQPIFARIDTPTSLSEDDVERHRLSTAPAFAIQSADDAQQITVLIFIKMLMVA